MQPEFCVWRDSQSVKILLLLTAIQRAACVSHTVRQGGGKKKGVGFCLEGVGMWLEMMLGSSKKRKMIWGVG